MKKVVILGSTGKIGRQTLDVIRSYADEFKVVGLACRRGTKEFWKQVEEFKPKITAVAEKEGEERVVEVATFEEADLVVVAVVGMAGLRPTLAAIKTGKNIALATKEVLVVAGEIVTREAKKQGIKIIPIDSEQSAIFQCLQAGRKREIKRLILTMGKGPIARMTKKQLEKITMRDVLDRPRWSMGEKIAIDSATGMNKAFEVIEAKWLFGVEAEKIEIVVHPEYLCHSLVEFIDGSIVGEFGTADMRRYIQYALFYPRRKEARVSSFVDLKSRKMSFEEPPFEKFPCLRLGYEALKAGGLMPAVMHGADRAAVEGFVKGKLRFTEIAKVIEKTMRNYKVKVRKSPSLAEIIEGEKWGRDYAERLIKGGRE